MIMIVESYAILAVLVVMALMAAHTGRQSIAILAVPLAGIPLFHLLGNMLRADLLLFDAIGLLWGLLLSFIFALRFKSRRARAGCLLICLPFVTALFVAYYLNCSVYLTV